MWHESKTVANDHEAAAARGAEDIRYTDTATHAIDIFGRQYDRSVPAFIETGDGMVFDRAHRDGRGGADLGGPYVHIDDLNALALERKYVFGPDEIGEAPEWYNEANPLAGPIGFDSGFGISAPPFDYRLAPPDWLLDSVAPMWNARGVAFNDQTSGDPVEVDGDAVALMRDISARNRVEVEGVPNGEFDTTDGWILKSNTTIENGQLTIDTTGDNDWYQNAQSATNITVAGTRVKYEINVAESTGDLWIRLGDGASLADYIQISGAGVFTGEHQMIGGGQVWIEDRHSVADRFVVNSVSVKKIAGVSATQTTADDQPILMDGRLKFDDTDSLSVTLPAMTDATHWHVDESGVWIEDGLTISAGSRDLHNSDWSAAGYVDHVLTADELNQLIQWANLEDHTDAQYATVVTRMNAICLNAVATKLYDTTRDDLLADGSTWRDGMGEVGAEKVTNDGFDDTSGWTINGGATIADGFGNLFSTGDAFKQDLIDTQSSTEIVTISYTTVTNGNLRVYLAGTLLFDGAISGDGVLNLLLTGGTNSDEFQIRSNGWTGAIDSASVRKPAQSWYHEELNTATRGSTRNFPERAIIVAEVSSVVIYDATDPAYPMWMVFNGTGNTPTYQLGFWMPSSNTHIATSVGAKNGQVLFGVSSGASHPKNGLCGVEFTNDNLYRQANTFSIIGGTGLSVAQRHAVVDLPTRLTADIVTNTVNAVAITTLVGAPIGAVTGLPVPTIGVGTNGGTSVIANDGNVYDSGYSSPITVMSIVADRLICRAGSTATPLQQYDMTGISADGFAPERMYRRRDGTAGKYPQIGFSSYNIYISGVSLDNMAMGYPTSTVDAGVYVLSQGAAVNATGASNDLMCQITHEWTSGYQVGDISGAWLADTDDTDLVGPVRHFENGSSTAGWLTGAGGGSVVVVNGALRVTGPGTPSYPSVAKGFPTVIGKSYRIAGDLVVSDSVQGHMIKSDSQTNWGIGRVDIIANQFAPYSGSVSIVATATTTYIHLLAGAGGQAMDFDNIELIEATSDDFTGYPDTTAMLAVWDEFSTGTGTITLNSGTLLLTSVDNSNRAKVERKFQSQIGQVHLFKVTVSGDSLRTIIATATGFGGTRNFDQTLAVGTHEIIVIPTASTSYVAFQYEPGGTATIDDVEFALVDEDRSVNDNPLNVIGNITRTPVADDAELVAYSGFSNSGDYLEQPYNADLRFGPNNEPWSAIFWTYHANLTGSQGAETYFCAMSSTGKDMKFEKRSGSSVIRGSQTGRGTTGSSGNLTAGEWNFVGIVYDGSVLRFYIEGVQSGADTNTPSFDWNLCDMETRFGQNELTSARHLGSMALFRISATAPTAAQIAKIYADEKPLFQEKSACTLNGATAAVTAVSHDPVTGLLHVGQSDGTSVFAGLERVTESEYVITSNMDALDGVVSGK